MNQVWIKGETVNSTGELSEEASAIKLDVDIETGPLDDDFLDNEESKHSIDKERDSDEYKWSPRSTRASNTGQSVATKLHKDTNKSAWYNLNNSAMVEITPRRRSRSTRRQQDFLVSYLLAHKEMFLGKVKTPREMSRREAMWGRLAEKMSELGPAKTQAQVKTSWRDLRVKVMAKYKSLMKSSGDGAERAQIAITPLEQKVLKIIDLTSHEKYREHEPTGVYLDNDEMDFDLSSNVSRTETDANQLENKTELDTSDNDSTPLKRLKLQTADDTRAAASRGDKRTEARAGRCNPARRARHGAEQRSKPIHAASDDDGDLGDGHGRNHLWRSIAGMMKRGLEINELLLSEQRRANTLHTNMCRQQIELMRERNQIERERNQLMRTRLKMMEQHEGASN